MAGFGSATTAEALSGVNAAFQAGMHISAQAEQERLAQDASDKQSADRNAESASENAATNAAAIKSQQLQNNRLGYQTLAATLSAHRTASLAAAAEPGISLGLSAQNSVNAANDSQQLNHITQQMESGQTVAQDPSYAPVSVVPLPEDLQNAKDDRALKNAQLVSGIVENARKYQPKPPVPMDPVRAAYLKSKTDENIARTKQIASGGAEGKKTLGEQLPDLAASYTQNPSDTLAGKVGAAHSEVMTGLVGGDYGEDVLPVLGALTEHAQIPLQDFAKPQYRAKVLNWLQSMQRAPNAYGLDPDAVGKVNKLLGGDVSGEGDSTSDPKKVGYVRTPEEQMRQQIVEDPDSLYSGGVQAAKPNN